MGGAAIGAVTAAVGIGPARVVEGFASGGSTTHAFAEMQFATAAPVIAIPGAALGLAFAQGVALPASMAHGMFIGEHGSWNRAVPAGYKVVFVPFADGKPNGAPIDVLTGFVSDKGEAWGRPVGVALDQRGALLVADDVGNTIWRAVTPGKEVARR